MGGPAASPAHFRAALNGYLVEDLLPKELQAEVLDGRQLGVSLGVQPEVPEVELESVAGVSSLGRCGWNRDYYEWILATLLGSICGHSWALLGATEDRVREALDKFHTLGAVTSRGRKTTSVDWRSALDSRCLILKGIGGVCPDVRLCPSN